jgi:Gpi18-like mannosyltransferase
MGALAVHVVAFFGYPPGDIYVFVRPWYRELLVHGLSQPVGNYSPPYIYLLWALTLFDGLLWQILLIKLLSLVGALWLVLAARRLLAALDSPLNLAWLTLLLPSVLLNTSLLGQADTFWIAPCVLATAAAVKRDYFKVALWSGIAFAFKAQAAFFAPFVIYLFVSEGVPARTWLIAPLAFLGAMVPAFVAGWPASYIAGIYLGQADWVNNRGLFVGDGASWWTLFGYLAPDMAHRLRWLGIPLILGGVASYWYFLPKLRKEMILPAAIISAGGVPFLLPMMLDRFFMLADILALLFALAYPSRRSVTAAALIQIASAFPVFVWAFRLQPWDALAAPLMTAGLVLTVAEMKKLAARIARPCRPSSRAGKTWRLNADGC